jgi:hypothetical protein
MPLFFYLPLIVWSGMVEIMLDTTHDPDGQNDQRDPANPMMDTASIIRFPMPAADSHLGGASAA